MRTISNQKYEITDMAHEEYPFLHRIRALRDICGEIRAGDIGGFVESESNLSAEPGDCAWIFDDAIAAGDAYVDRDACLRGDAIACGSAYVSKGSVMSGHSRAEDNAYLRGASMTGKALASGNAQIIHDPHTMGTPILSGNCKVYGTVQGDIRITGSAVILPCEEVRNDTRDTFVLSGKSRSVIRGIGRETLKPLQKEVSPMKTKNAKETRCGAMTVYEQELRKLFEHSNLVDQPQFSGRVCVGDLGKDLRVRAEFLSTHISSQYDAIRLTVLNRTEGVVDRTLLRFQDVWGKKQVPNNPNFRSGVIPHLWDDYGKVEWYAYHPTAADYAALRDAVGQYLSTFRERTPELERSGSKLVYICAPLRGDVTNNVEFARQKAQEVFVEGNIPICPHLLFPPVADPADPAQDEKARAMGLRLLESCQQMNVYGPVWTDGMWQEIYKAGELGIPVLTDQKTIGRTLPARHPKRKER